MFDNGSLFYLARDLGFRFGLGSVGLIVLSRGDGSANLVKNLQVGVHVVCSMGMWPEETGAGQSACPDEEMEFWRASRRNPLLIIARPHDIIRPQL